MYILSRIAACFAILFLATPCIVVCQRITTRNDVTNKKIYFGNEKVSMVLDYNHKAVITSLVVNAQQLIHSDSGMYAAIQTPKVLYSTLQLKSDPSIRIDHDGITVKILYGDAACRIQENWTFRVSAKAITFKTNRTFSRPVTIEKASLPVFMFNDINSWEGAYQDYGGIAWFYLFNKKLDTYGVHSKSSRFWNSKTGNGLTIAVDAPGNAVAMDYSRTATDKLAFTIGVAPREFIPRHDAGTQRRRFVRNRTDVWAAFQQPATTTSAIITLSFYDVEEQFGRGKLVGINQQQVSAVLNTIACIGVIDKQHFGGNSWHTPYGPICLHEQYIAQMGIAINDPHYLKGYQQCLDYYRDNAIKPDGRVWARWAYTNEDMMPGEVTDKGFYEAQWGYLLDANPDLVTNVAELYDQTGDLQWVKTHQLSCEKVLDWIINRDSDHNGLVEMMTDNHTQKRGSDWIDIIWAAYENAFVNAKLYLALTKWAAIERQLGNTVKENEYRRFAQQLKTSFNKPVRAGGFWDEEKKCYVHWRDKDGSIHGNNMVTPVNFMAIAYGICDDIVGIKAILDEIETQMQKEDLFFWPICLYSYNKGEGNDWQFPFPVYENGDLFLSWGAVAVQAYAAYKPELAVKYVKNVLAQYAKDGLAFQRYGRAKQDGLGDDILSGNSLAVVGLYTSIYGINPRYNRLFLKPRIVADLDGTEIKYRFRGRQLTIGLIPGRYTVSDKRFTLQAKDDFGFYSTDTSVQFFHGSNERVSMQATTKAAGKFSFSIDSWEPEEFVWTQAATQARAHSVTYRIDDALPAIAYTIYVNDKLYKKVKSNAAGSLSFRYTSPSKAGKGLSTSTTRIRIVENSK